MEDCSKTSAGAVSGLPDDPLLEILSCVPAKSVCRFKCVSKAWRDLIDDPDNRKKLCQPMQGLFVQMPEYDESDDDEFDHNTFSFIKLTLGSVPLDIDPSFSFLTDMTGISTFLLDSCNGFILFGHCQERFGPQHYTVCNPTTKQWSAVPASVPACGSGPLSFTYLAFAPAVSSHFHLVQFQMPDLCVEIVALHVYSSETGTWSQNQIDEQKEQGQLEGRHHRFTIDGETLNHLCAFVNGFLHVMVSSLELNLRRILVVDLQGKARRLITLPNVADGRHAYVCYLGQSQGHLHCVTEECTDENPKVSTWVLRDYDAQEWVLKNTVHSLDVFRETGGMLDFRVVDMHQDCNLVLFFNQWNYELIAYNMDSKEVSVMATFEDRKEPCEFSRYIPYYLESPALTNKQWECAL